MLRIFLILCCLVCFQNDEPVISWNESYKLSWSDFKDKPQKHNDVAAVTASGITFGFSIRQTDRNQVVSFNTDVHAHFYPEQSWYKVEVADNHILGHEQLHFDITELYARKFRHRISKLRVSNNVRRQLKKIHNDINSELSRLQTQYDNETDYSRNYEAQVKWHKIIKAELKAFSKFKSVE